MRKLPILFLLILLAGINAKAQVRDSIQLKNATLYYSLYGKTTPILLLSGGPGFSGSMLEPIATALSMSYQSILFDQRGTGSSITIPLDSTTINLAQAVDDINLLKKKLSINKIIILGHSWGAMLALYYATRFPDQVKKLVLVGPGPLDGLIDFAEDNRMARATAEEKESIKKIADSLENGKANAQTFSNLSKRFLRLDVYDANKVDSLFPILTKAGMPNFVMGDLMWKDVVKHYDIKKNLAQLNIPVLVLCGRQDPVGIFPAFELSALNKHIIVHWINKCGHFPFLEQPQEFYATLNSFLKEN